MAVRDDAAKGLYEETLFRRTPVGAGLNVDERSFLRAIQAARRHPDPDEIGKWLGWEEAHEIKARLRPRLHRPPARIAGTPSTSRSACTNLTSASEASTSTGPLPGPLSYATKKTPPFSYLCSYP